MSSITKVNLNGQVVNVGRTTPVSPGPQTASKSIPVVLATDQRAIPVEEQNKVQSEVALSLLGIPRAEVALGIFADVNTYDVNPSEWSNTPEYYVAGHGIKHLPNEAGALVEAPRNTTSVLTSKRFFRYQPGRVSAATFGIKSSVSIAEYARNQVIRKYGIYDKFDGYYWETRQNGEGDNFSVVRRTQSLLKNPVSPFGIQGEAFAGAADINTRTSPGIPVTQRDDYRIVGHPPAAEFFKSTGFPKDIKVAKDFKFDIINKIVADTEAAYTAATTVDAEIDVSTAGDGSVIYITSGNYYKDLKAAINARTGSGSNDGGNITDAEAAVIKGKCKRDLEYWLDFTLLDAEWGGTGHTQINLSNFINAILPRPDNFEKLLYTTAKELFDRNTNLADLLAAFSDPSKTFTDDFADKMLALFGIIETAFDFDNTGSIVSNLVDFSTFNDYGRRSKLDTIYSTKKHYWAYIISLYKVDSSLYVYDVPTGFTEEEIKYKCQRDSGYLIEGYRDDIIGGGNGVTKYNASMYLRGDRANGLAIYSQTEDDGTTPVEIARQAFLKNLILHDLMGAAQFTAHRNTKDGTTDYDDAIDGANAGIYKNGLQNANGFGYAPASSVTDKQETLGQLISNNISIQDTTALSTGQRGFAGNLITLRDGLIMVHGAVNDPSMLKDKVKIRAVADDLENMFTLTEGVVTFGQHVRYFGPDDIVEGSDPISQYPTKLVNGGVYQVVSVHGPKGNSFKLNSGTGSALTFSSDITDSNEVYFETVVPFMMPDTNFFPEYGTGGPKWSYDPASYRAADKFTLTDGGLGIQEVDDRDDDPFPPGMMFPYMYSSGISLSSYSESDITNVEDMFVGFVDTSNVLETEQDVQRLRREVDRVNFIPEYINWIKNNVKPEFWGVYEYRVPRSRYSHDKLNGKNNTIVFSDVATDEGGRIARPGQIYNPGGIVQSFQSAYNFDFTKVTMLKVEFSWYGAVGALFLAYVPVENGEARWVRVHHLRASNQLKISSLGNATLPITYNVYGGGDSISLGDGEEEGGTAPIKVQHQYENYSHNLVKYGASYYIDGGDRGTVRLYSYNNEETVQVQGKVWSCAAPLDYGTDDTYGTWISTANMNVWDFSTGQGSISSILPTFFMGAKVITNDPQDQNLRVVWVDEQNNRAYIDRPFNGVPSSISFIPDRSTSVFGLETKRVILSTLEKNAVRNRVQVYPTKLSTSNLSDSNPIRLRMKKTPLFQNRDVVPNGTLELSADYDVTAENLPLPVTVGSASYLENGEELYGWFRAKVGIDDETVLARLYKEANDYYVDVLQNFSGTVTLKQDEFLSDKIFNQRGADSSQVVVDDVYNEIDGLSSIVIAKKGQVPIPNTGINITTIYLNRGTEQLDLAGYFDYNKEYLSFPLTDQADTLYLTVDSDADQASAPDRVSLGITWEEQ